MIILADTSPLNYLILIGSVDVLEAIFARIVVPPAVRDELRRPGSPQLIRDWIETPPDWIQIQSPVRLDSSLRLGKGEVEAISLAIELEADLLLIDDRLGRRAAVARGLAVAGTVNVLDAAAERGLIDLPAAVAKLRLTNFHAPEKILTNLMQIDAQRKGHRQE